jgi:outer membrane translocation and assembly module TamA
VLTAARALTMLLASIFASLAGLCAGCSSLPHGEMAVDSVSVRGTGAEENDDVASKVATTPSPKFLGLFPGLVFDYEIFNAATLQKDLARVERFYRARGYYAAHARAGRVIDAGPRHVRVEIVVEEGLPTNNAELTFEGLESLPADVQEAVRAAARAALAKGAPFDEDQAANCEHDAVKALTDRGHAYAAAKRDTYVDVVHRLANTNLAMTPGPTATFGPVTIEGLDPDGAGPRPQEIPEAPLRRTIGIQEGEPYSTARIDAATQALLDLEVFAAVTAVPDVSNPATRVVPVHFHVEPTKLRQLRLGGGIELDEIKSELHLLAGWEDHDFFGGLRDFSVDFMPGVVLYPTRIDDLVAPSAAFPEERLRAQLKQPGFLEARTQGFIRPEVNVFPLLVETNPSATDPVVGYLELKGAVGADRSFFKNLYASLSYVGQVEDPFAFKGALDPDLRSLVILYPDLELRLDERDNHDHPHGGFYLANDLQVAGGVFGGNAHDVKVQPEARVYVPLSKRVTLATRGSVGFLFPSNYGDSVENHISDPVTAANRAERVSDIETVLFRGFFSGGPTSNRGFPLRGVSPHGVVPFLNPLTAAQQVALSCNPPSAANGYAQPDPSVCSIPIGGFTLWELSTELRFPIKGPLWGATFCDAGDVSQHPLGQPQAFRLDHPHVSCGAGVRYDTPVGPIRVDIGYRVQPLQVLGYPNEVAAYLHDPSNGLQPTFFGGSSLGSGIPVTIDVGIGEAY